jgi:hypothetical protein
MTKDEVKIGHTYEAKVSNRIVTVRIDSTNSHGGWNATNTATGKRIRIKSARRLWRPVETAGGGETQPAQKRRPKQPAEPRPRRVGALDAAAQVLADAGQPMRAKELIEAMAERGLWTSPNGKTPESTLYAAILREIGAKSDKARFRKTGRGQFAFCG